MGERAFIAFLAGIFGVILSCGMMIEGSIQKMRENQKAEDGLKDAKPAIYAPWYVCNKEEVARTCAAQRRMEPIKGKAT